MFVFSVFRAFVGPNEHLSKRVVEDVRGLHPEMDKTDIESMFRFQFFCSSALIYVTSCNQPSF